METGRDPEKVIQTIISVKGWSVSDFSDVERPCSKTRSSSWQPRTDFTVNNNVYMLSLDPRPTWSGCPNLCRSRSFSWHFLSVPRSFGQSGTFCANLTRFSRKCFRAFYFFYFFIYRDSKILSRIESEFWGKNKIK